ncbi:MAG: hypothetical protein BECKG1743D_GA0114223_112461, partial [Candidatus Kentron sp. G]
LLSQAQDSSLTHSTLQLRATMSAIRHPCLIMGQCPSNFEGRNTWIRENRARFYSLAQDLIALKNPAFKEEQEVRAIRCVERGKALTRVSDQVIIPYIEANFWEDDEALSDMHLAMPEIWLGPKSNEQNRKGISSLGTWLVNRYDCGYI